MRTIDDEILKLTIENLKQEIKQSSGQTQQACMDALSYLIRQAHGIGLKKP
jgi:hypothetical protein